MVVISGGTDDGTEVPWAEAAPFRHEGKVLSVVCGNTHLHWAVHNGIQDNFAPAVFWRTPPLDAKELKEDPCAILGRHLPTLAHDVVFGEKCPPTKACAAAASSQRQAPALSIYTVITNAQHQKSLDFLFQDVAHRVYRIENTDFFSEEQGCYGTIGVDRVACLFASRLSSPGPVMVFDGGTAWTYTAMNAKGRIIGGGISPGIGARFRCLSDYCGNLPIIDFDEYHQTLQKALEEKQLVPIFATDTKTAMITTVFQEVTSQCRNLVKQFLEVVKKEREEATAPAENGGNDAIAHISKPTIFVTGGDAGFLASALENAQPFIVSTEPGVKVPTEDFVLETSKHLPHYGIGKLLAAKLQEAGPPGPDDQLRDRMIGQRVARQFDAPDPDGEFLYRGTILTVKVGDTFEEDLYWVRYDDGDSEHYSVLELYDALKLYATHGEKPVTKHQEWTEEQKADKKAKSGTSAETMFERSDILKKQVEEAAAKAEAEAKEAGNKRKRTSTGRPRGRPKKVKDDTPKKSKEEVGKEAVKKRVAKFFPLENSAGTISDQLFFGTVESYDGGKNFWHIIYDDNDQEDFDENDLRVAFDIYEENKLKDERRNPGTSAVEGVETLGNGDAAAKTVPASDATGQPAAVAPPATQGNAQT